jgi:hypothetical protein
MSNKRKRRQKKKKKKKKDRLRLGFWVKRRSVSEKRREAHRIIDSDFVDLLYTTLEMVHVPQTLGVREYSKVRAFRRCSSSPTSSHSEKVFVQNVLGSL